MQFTSLRQMAATIAAQQSFDLPFSSSKFSYNLSSFSTHSCYMAEPSFVTRISECSRNSAAQF